MSFTPASMASLQELLGSLYGDTDLRTLAMLAFPDNPAIYLSLPGSGASLKELAASLVLLVARHYDRPPASLWSYLYSTRPQRAQEIDRARAIDEPAEDRCEPPRVPPASDRDVDLLHLVVPLGGGPRGRCDLLAGMAILPGTSPRTPHTSELAFIQRYFADLKPGRVNGLERAFILAWSEAGLNLTVTPSLSSERRIGPRNLHLPVPVSGVAHDYYPCGSGHVRVGATRPLSYRFIVDDWSARARRVSFVEVMQRRLTFVFE